MTVLVLGACGSDTAKDTVGATSTSGESTSSEPGPTSGDGTDSGPGPTSGDGTDSDATDTGAVEKQSIWLVAHAEDADQEKVWALDLSDPLQAGERQTLRSISRDKAMSVASTPAIFDAAIMLNDKVAEFVSIDAEGLPQVTSPLPASWAGNKLISIPPRFAKTRPIILTHIHAAEDLDHGEVWAVTVEDGAPIATSRIENLPTPPYLELLLWHGMEIDDDGDYALFHAKPLDDPFHLAMFQAKLTPSVGDAQQLPGTTGIQQHWVNGDRLFVENYTSEDHWAYGVRDARDPSAPTMPVVSGLLDPGVYGDCINPDGSRMTYAVGSGDNLDKSIYLVEFDDFVPSDPLLLVEAGAGFCGKFVTNDLLIYFVDGTWMRIDLAGKSPSAPVPITGAIVPADEYGTFTQISPDRRWLAHGLLREGKHLLVFTDVTSATPTPFEIEVDSPLSDFERPPITFFADDRAFFSAYRGGDDRDQVYIIDLSTDPPTFNPITDGLPGPFVATGQVVTPQGDQMIVTVSETDESDDYVYRVGIQGTEVTTPPEQLTMGTGDKYMSFVLLEG